MATIDFAKSLRDLYTAKRTIQEVTAAPGTFLMVDGQGEPGGTRFQEAVRDLYTLAYTIKFAEAKLRPCDFKVSKLECLWFSDPATPLAQWRWRLMVRIPDAVSARHLSHARKAVKAKKGWDLRAVKRVRWSEGRALQVLHVGPYEKLGDTYAGLVAHAGQQGCRVKGPGHEIYLSDPRKTAPQRLKTIVRLAIAKGRSTAKK